jgi:hypothetical protein
MFGILGFIAGIILIIIGGLLVFLFPSATSYQPSEMVTLVVVVGFVMIILGAIMVFI